MGREGNKDQVIAPKATREPEWDLSEYLRFMEAI